MKMETWICGVCEDLEHVCIFTTQENTSVPTACPWETGVEPTWTQPEREAPDVLRHNQEHDSGKASEPTTTTEGE